MDTRTKIVSPSELDRFPGAVFVSGYFDPLLAAHAKRLSEIAAAGKPLVVLLADPPAPLLDSRARAELLAGLVSVAAVVLPDAEGLSAPGNAIAEQTADLERRDWLVERVRSRHANGGQ